MPINGPQMGASMPPDMSAMPPPSPEEVQRARRAVCRRVASAIIAAMAEYDADFEQLARRLQRTPDVARAFIHRMIEGESSAGDLEMLSDLTTAMNSAMVPSVGRRREFVEKLQSHPKHQLRLRTSRIKALT